MSYRALYRVFRPQTFGEVVGQAHISQTLLNAITHNRLAHAYLFCGPRGTGKTSSAKILAKAVNCLNPQDGEPCNACANCLAINGDHFLDVLEIDAASNRGIDEIREIRDKVKFAPSEGKRKVYIIDEVHMLTNEAFNALLKTLEEPPEHVLFILATTDPQKIPLTVLSRCQRFDFRKIGTAEIRQHLAEIVAAEQIAISEEAIMAIARKAAGGMRDAISVLDQCIAFAGDRIEAAHVQMVLGTLSEEDMAHLVAFMIADDYSGLFTAVNAFLATGKDIKQMVRDLLEYTRQLLLLKVAPQEQLLTLSEGVLSTAKGQAEILSVPFLSEALNRLGTLDKELKFANQPQILLETALVELILLKDKGQSQAPTAPPPIVQPAPIAPKATSAPKKKLLHDEDIIAQWPNILAQLKKTKMGAYTILKEVVPQGLDNDALILQFPPDSAFKVHRLELAENKQALEKLLLEFCGKPIKARFFQEKQAGEFEQTYDIYDDAVKVFGAEKVEVIEQ